MAHRDLRGLSEGQLGSPINCVVSQSSGNFSSNTSGTYTPVTNFSVTINCTGDYPVQVRIIGDGSANGSFLGPSASGTRASVALNLQLLRDGVVVDYVATNIAYGTSGSAPNLLWFPSSYFFLDFPPKGTHTYTIQTGGGSTTYSQQVAYCKMLAYEDRTLIYK